MIEVLGVVKHQVESHVHREVLSVKVVVPKSAFRDHEEAKELIGKNHLHLFVEVLPVIIWLIWLHRSLLVLLAPLKAL